MQIMVEIMQLFEVVNINEIILWVCFTILWDISENLELNGLVNL